MLIKPHQLKYLDNLLYQIDHFFHLHKLKIQVNSKIFHFLSFLDIVIFVDVLLYKFLFPINGSHLYFALWLNE